MSRHEPKHNHCEHEPKICGHCDVAYCGKCSKEWGAPCTMNHYPQYYSVPCTRPHVPGYISPLWGSAGGTAGIINMTGATSLATSGYSQIVEDTVGVAETITTVACSHE